MANQQLIETIKEIANDRIEEILDALGFDMDVINGVGHEIRTRCLLHGGENPTSFCYNTESMNWICFAGNCQGENSSIFGLVQKCKQCTFTESVKWLSEFLKISSKSDIMLMNAESVELGKLIRESRKRKIVTQNKDTFSPLPVRAFQNIEVSKYFLDKGFTKEILQKYHVGYCDNKYEPMYLRSYTPIINDNGDKVVGMTGRIIYEKCEFCPTFHEKGRGCPHENPKVKGFSKWKHFGFNSSQVLYNYWIAKEYIRKNNFAILTEGPKDVWWLEQHGIQGGLGIFGLKVHKNHIEKLIQSNVLTVLLAVDNDKMGNLAYKHIVNQLSSIFKLVNISQFMKQDEDIADIQSDKILSEVKPFIKSFENHV